MVLFYPLRFLLLTLVTFVIPGILVVRAVAPRRFERSFFAVAVGFGVVSVGYFNLLFVGLLGLVWEVHASVWSMLGVASLHAIPALLWLRWREGGFGFLRELFWTAPKRAFDWKLLLFLAVVVGAYLLSYHSSLFDQERCVLRAGMLPLYDYLEENVPVAFPGCLECFDGRNGFLLWNGGQRMGPSVFVSGFGALFGFAGLRLVHVFFGLLTGWFGFHLGRSVLGSKRWGFVLGAGLALNPYALSIPLLDENIMSLGLGTAIFYLVLARRTSWLLVGAFVGVFLGIRHVGVLSFPALVLAAWYTRDPFEVPLISEWLGGRRWATVVALVVSTLVFCIPWIIIHTAGHLVGGGHYESFVSTSPVPYHLFGIDFEMNALLSWPFLPEPVRSPYNGFPTLVSFPLTFLRTWGILGVALLPLGVWGLWRRYRLSIWVSALWLLPEMAMLMVMANWVQPNKMGVFLCFSQGFVLLIVGGAQNVVGRILRWREGVSPVLLSGGIWLSFVVLFGSFSFWSQGYVAKVDERNFTYRVNYILQDYTVTPPMQRSEEEEYAAIDRKELAGPHWLPDVTMALHLFRPAILQVRWRRLLADWRLPRFDEYCQRATDVQHRLSMIPNPEALGVARCTSDKCDNSFVSLKAMMHKPVSSERIDNERKIRRCFADATYRGPTSTVALNLADAPPGNEDIVSLVDSDQGIVVGNDILVAVNQHLPWAPALRTHLAVIPIWPGYYHIAIWFGRYEFDHLDSLPGVKVVSDLMVNGVLPLKIKDDSVIRLVISTSIEPTRRHVWDIEVTPDGIVQFGPKASSY